MFDAHCAAQFSKPCQSKLGALYSIHSPYSILFSVFMTKKIDLSIFRIINTMRMERNERKNRSDSGLFLGFCCCCFVVFFSPSVFPFDVFDESKSRVCATSERGDGTLLHKQRFALRMWAKRNR